ncbi:lipid-A-disaccharide synthase [Devosia rhodophyticola]|uniref:Lipid-A-disaccharide synthase n=1 Tax=Devosia rhodophyticola TaxID=3026423 RepID=A0ABY7YXB8_9HYPH|nr:lipid-A-disaccharide synthase [Devosia rhodophyticola]WDR05896.1 lipid-A-disaccharide synthase [Devosia rhodophyticola]
MVDSLKFFIVAGEPSGDRIAGDLVRRLQSRLPLNLAGVGGDEMTALGLSPIFPMDDLSVMGLTDVIKRLPLLLWRVEQTAREIVRRVPDVVVLVDAQDFSKRVAKRARALGFKGPMILFGAPTVWARGPERAAKLQPLFDEVLAVLPFEPEVMARLGGPPTSYVGHPALKDVAVSSRRATGKIALLPGSRSGELRRHMPLLRILAERFMDHPGVEGFFIPTLPHLAEKMRTEVAGWPMPVEIGAVRAERAYHYGQTLMALSVAGTATLELALAKLPMILIYSMDAAQAAAYRRIGKPLVGLPNIIAGSAIVPEFVARSPNLEEIATAAVHLVENEEARQRQVAAFDELAKLMQSGAPDAPRQNPEDRILAHLPKFSAC